MIYFNWKTRHFEIPVPKDCQMESYLKGYSDALNDVRSLIKVKPNNKERIDIVMKFINHLIGE